MEPAPVDDSQKYLGGAPQAALSEAMVRGASPR